MKILQKRANSAARLEIPWPVKTVGPTCDVYHQGIPLQDPSNKTVHTEQWTFNLSQHKEPPWKKN